MKFIVIAGIWIIVFLFYLALFKASSKEDEYFEKELKLEE